MALHFDAETDVLDGTEVAKWWDENKSDVDKKLTPLQTFEMITPTKQED